MKLGTFEVTSGKIIVTDPCYEFDGVKVIPAKNGNWTASLETNKYGEVAELIVLHDDFYRNGVCEEILDFTCPVDSGQAGIFDAEQYAKYQGGEYEDTNSFYGKICHMTCETEEMGGTINMDGHVFGAASMSGCGDGNYEIAGFYAKGVLLGIRIYFGNYSESELNGEEENW